VASADPKLRVVVAGTPTGPTFAYEGTEPSPGASWAELPKATILADPGETLGSVLGRAAGELGVIVPFEVVRINANIRAQEGKPPQPAAGVADGLWYAAFHRPDDDEPPEVPEGSRRRDARSRRPTVLVVRDSQGRALWRRPPFTATMGELVDAHQVGLLVGDPLKPYLVLSIPQGLVDVLGEWRHLQEALEAGWQLRGAALELITLFSFLGAVRRRLRRRSADAARVVERNAPDWAARGAAPEDLRRLLASRPRRGSEIAALLGCSEAEAEAILWGLGFTPRDDGTWTPRLSAGDRLRSRVYGLTDRLREIAGRR
jgi:hypothetical protein